MTGSPPTPMRVIALGVHVVDVLVRPVQEIPEGQSGQLVDSIRITAAGPAGGTALTLAKLGAEVRSAGAIGSDALGDVLVDLLARSGVDPGLLVRRPDVQTSASVLPIRPDGSRPAFHVIGANATYTAADAPRDAIRESTHLHLGAPGRRRRRRRRALGAHRGASDCRRRPVSDRAGGPRPGRRGAGRQARG